MLYVKICFRGKCKAQFYRAMLCRVWYRHGKLSVCDVEVL